MHPITACGIETLQERFRLSSEPRCMHPITACGIGTKKQKAPILVVGLVLLLLKAECLMCGFVVSMSSDDLSKPSVMTAF